MKFYDYYNNPKKALVYVPMDKMAELVAVLERARDEGKTVYTFGNGGSASTASHMAADLSKGANRDGYNRIKAHCLSDNIASFTAWSNDEGYNEAFANRVYGLVEKNDVAIGISGSGNSLNVIKGLRIAALQDAYTVALTGFDGGVIKGEADLVIIVPCFIMEVVEDIHLIIEHMITTALREGFDKS